MTFKKAPVRAAGAFLFANAVFGSFFYTQGRQYFPVANMTQLAFFEGRASWPRRLYTMAGAY